jgi:hypothetical protein
LGDPPGGPAGLQHGATPHPAHQHTPRPSPLQHEDYAHGQGRAGGPQAVGGGKKWPDSNGHGICGDAPGSNKYDTPNEVQATYSPGQTVSLKVLLSTNHLGRFLFRLCPLSATQDSQCEVLQRWVWRVGGVSFAAVCLELQTAPAADACPSLPPAVQG